MLGENYSVDMYSGFPMETNTGKDLESPKITVNDLSSDTSGDGINEKKFDIYK